MQKIFPAITLYQPWATWIIRGWKTIETRTHDRFKGLKGKTILIHAGMQTDSQAANCPYLNPLEISWNPDEMVNGFILGSAFVYDFKLLHPGQDEKKSLIECSTKRYGLVLTNIKKIDPIPCKGEMGIWYYDLNKKEKVKKPTSQISIF